jgi:C-terminal processing protease CtpA/Prc
MINRISVLLYTFVVFVLFTGCSGETTPIDKPVTQNEVNHWIEQEMRQQYLWCDEMPESGKLEFPLEPDQFFHSLLSKKDGKDRNGGHQYYSTINKKDATSKAYLGDGNSFGFEFQWYYVTNVKKYGLMVLYVLPDSPASEEKLKRGDWIFTINDKPVPNNSAELTTLLLDATTSKTLKIEISERFDQAVSRTVSITSRPVTDDPVLVHKTIPSGDGRKVGYLLYNHFTSGPGGSEDETFNNSLRSAFARFADDNVNEFVLDLRFNGGGLVTCAQLLATMLAPQSALGNVFCHLTYNDKRKESNHTLSLDRKRINEGVPGANLNLSRLFIITSDRTASASEMIINGLSPYKEMELIQVGTKTEGKNVASIPITDDRYEWELHPIVSYLSNKDNNSDYANGFPPTPGFECDDSKQGDYYPLGDPEEYILAHILNYLESGTFAKSKSQPLRSAETVNLIPLYNSLDAKKTNGVAILPADFYRP